MSNLRLLALANGCIECGIPYAASDYDTAWAECLQAEQKDVAQAYQRLQESEKRVKSELIDLMDQSALERVTVILGGRGELSIEQTLRNQPLEKLPNNWHAPCAPRSLPLRRHGFPSLPQHLPLS